MTLKNRFDVTLRFLSDWHIGTGQGRLGTIDAEIRRDATGLPFVPAKTLIGVWRDACETVAATFDRTIDQSGPWSAWVTWLFGSQVGAPTPDPDQGPLPAALRVTPARAPAWLRHRVQRYPALAAATVVLRPGVQIDDETGTAADHLLRVEERAIQGLVLHAQVSVGDDQADRSLPEPAELLLRAGARLVEAVGGKRNRGSGRMAFLLPDASLTEDGPYVTVTDDVLAALLAEGVPTPTPPPWSTTRPTVHVYARRHQGPRRTVRLVLRAATPVVAAAGVVSNITLCRDAIPGTALLRTILARVTSTKPDGEIGLEDIRVGDAVPAIGNPRDPASVVPARPAPMVWHRGDKGRGHSVHNILHGQQVEQRGKPMSGWIAPGKTDRSREDEFWHHVVPAKVAATHAVVDDAARRPTVASGGVYTYLGIAPGTLLCSDIVLPASLRLGLTPGEKLRFGRSRKDDYGLVEVVGVIDPVPAPAAPPIRPGTLRVWCLSDVLLRDARLAPDPSPQALARALSAALAPASFHVDEEGTVCAVTRREGFAVAWGRPRPSQLALRAGSVISLTVTGSVDPDRLAELERDGIGERTVEGFGRIRFNPSELEAAQPSVRFDTPPQIGEDTSDSAGDGLDLDEPHPVELHAWRRAIRQASAALTPHQLILGHADDGSASARAQLGSLRAQLERLTLAGGEEMVRHWLHMTREIDARRKIWTEPVLDHLDKLLYADPDLIWQRLDLAGEQRRLVLDDGREDLIRQHLRTEALVVAFTAVLRRLQRGGADQVGAAVSDTDSLTAKGAR